MSQPIPKDNLFDFERSLEFDGTPPVSLQGKPAPAPSMIDLTSHIGEALSSSSSTQQTENHNNDPVPDEANEHHHAHIHHDVNAEEGREEEVVHAKGTTLEPRIMPHQDPQDHGMHHEKQAVKTEQSIASYSDPENGSGSFALGHIESEEDPQTHTASTFYQKYRLIFHLIIWLFFTA